MRHEDLAGRNCAKCCVFPWFFAGSQLLITRGRGISAAEDVRICTTPAQERDLEVKIVKNWQPRSTFGS